MSNRSLTNRNHGDWGFIYPVSAGISDYALEAAPQYLQAWFWMMVKIRIQVSYSYIRDFTATDTLGNTTEIIISSDGTYSYDEVVPVIAPALTAPKSIRLREGYPFNQYLSNSGGSFTGPDGLFCNTLYAQAGSTAAIGISYGYTFQEIDNGIPAGPPTPETLQPNYQFRLFCGPQFTPAGESPPNILKDGPSGGYYPTFDFSMTVVPGSETNDILNNPIDGLPDLMFACAYPTSPAIINSGGDPSDPMFIGGIPWGKVGTAHIDGISAPIFGFTGGYVQPAVSSPIVTWDGSDTLSVDVIITSEFYTP